MRFQAITQILLVGLSLVMIFTIIRPMFQDVQSNQTELARYRDAVSTAGQFTAKLNELRNRANSFSSEDLGALDAYIPSSIDQLSVSRDIAAMIEENEMIVQSVTAEEPESEIEEEEGGFDATIVEEVELPPAPDLDPGFVDPAFVDPSMDAAVTRSASLASEAERGLVTQNFSVKVLGTYDQMKAFLVDLERNDYPLRLTEFDFSVEEESQLYTFTISVETYALSST